MAYYKYSQFLQQQNGAEFDHIHEPGTAYLTPAFIAARGAVLAAHPRRATRYPHKTTISTTMLKVELGGSW